MIWPVWQNGTPQSMHRAPCSRKDVSGMCSWNSCQSNTRSGAGRVTATVRVYSMKPVVLPISSLPISNCRLPIYIFAKVVTSDSKKFQAQRICDFKSPIGNWQSAIPSFPTDSRQVMRVQLKGRHLCLFVGHAVVQHLPLCGAHAAIVVRDDADKSRQPFIPRKEHLGSAHAAGIFGVPKDHIFERFNILFIG